jgi:uncharacterized protein YndB with AHSA1/START domain
MKHQFKATSTFTINAPKEKVWDALTNPEIVKQYFFGTNLVADWKVDGMIYFRGEWEGKPYEDKGIITAITKNELLCYDYKSSWDTSEDIRENYLPIEYKLTESNGVTTLEITQGSATQEQANHSDENWKMVMNGMKELVEKQ